jgi:ActR/RegA family two-component response regulator
MEIWMSSSLSLEGLGELPVRWADHRETLATGRPVIEPGFALVPAMLGSEMVAVLYLAQPTDLSPSDAQVFAAPIAHAVRAAQADTGADLPQRVSPADEPKLRLLRLLERNEWNVASVARQLGVSRRTVYLRLRAFGIERKRVPKLYKKLPAEG